MQTPNLNQFKAWAQAHRQQALAVCAAKAFAECERERVDAYIQPIFDSFSFQYCGELADKCNLSGPVPREDLYLCDDPRVQDYYATCDAAHRVHGFTGPDGHCPAMIAENAVMEAERDLIEAGAKLMGIDSTALIYGDTREKLLDILLGACLVNERKAA